MVELGLQKFELHWPGLSDQDLFDPFLSGIRQTAVAFRVVVGEAHALQPHNMLA